MTKGIEVAVFPVAGMGTRFLPATKSCPKEMLPIIDRPLIQYAVDEAISAGIKELIFVTSSTKRSLEDYFDRNFELEHKLQSDNRLDLLEQIREVVPNDVKISYVRQKVQSGLGDAVLCAEHVVGKRDFAVLLADEVLAATPSCMKRMVQLYSETGNFQIAVQEKPEDQLHKYGVVARKENSMQIENVIEKPVAQQAPSNLAIIGRYVLSADIFSILKNTSFGVCGELQLTDAIASMLQHKNIYAYNYNGQRFDCGSVHGFVEATLYYAQQREDCKDLFSNLTIEIN